MQQHKQQQKRQSDIVLGSLVCNPFIDAKLFFGLDREELAPYVEG
jgi:hypothetical protein